MLPIYLHRFQHLRVARSRQYGEAPSLPCCWLCSELRTKKSPDQPAGALLFS